MGLAASSFADLVALGIAEASSLRPDLGFLDGDVTEAQMNAAAAMADAVLGYIAVRERNLFFGGAAGEDLDTIIMDRIGLARIPATRAYGPLTISRATSGTSGIISAGAQIATELESDGSRVVVTTDTDVVVPSTSFSSTIVGTAVDYGAAGNAIASSLNTFITTPLGDTAITVTNGEDFSGGNDSQSDEDYVAAARRLWQTQRRGTLAAIEAGALTTTGVAVAVATEDLFTGITILYVSDADGNSNGLMIRNVEKMLEDWRAAGSNVTVVGGVRGLLDLSVSIDEYEPGFDVAAATPTIIDAIATRVNRCRVGKDLPIDALTAAVIAPFAPLITAVSFPSIVLRSRGSSATYYENNGVIMAGGALIRIGATPIIIDGKATT